MLRLGTFRSPLTASILVLVLTLLPTTAALAQPGGPGLDPGAPAVSVIPGARTIDAMRFLGASSTADVWELESRREGEAPMPAGTFYVESRAAVPNVLDQTVAGTMKDETAIQGIEPSLALGSLQGTDGAFRHVAVLRIDSELLTDGVARRETVVVPILEAASERELADFAHELITTMDQAAAEWRARDVAPLPDGAAIGDRPTGKSTCQVHCHEIFQLRLDSCDDRVAVCIGPVGAAALACVLACTTVAPPLLPLCLAACVTGEILALTACLFELRACRRDAGIEQRQCLINCPPIEP